ncbi:MAG: hypothetical protein IAG10_23160 [Planctomycetaceae bacterium]|nr:hypothetical protein [Planctomycetaceae bacterium]
MLSSIVRSRRVGLLIVAALLISWLGGDEPVWSQAAKSKSKAAAKNLPELEDDYFKYAVVLTGEESPIATGKTVTLFQSNGKTLAEMEITDTQLGKGDETVKQFSIQDADGKKKQKLASGIVSRLRSGDRDYDVTLDPAKKGHVLIDVTQRDLDINVKLKASRRQLWEDPTDDERAKIIADYKEFLQRVQANYQFPMRLTETKFFLFFTDIPANQVAPYIANLDAMYSELCKGFGVPLGKNIWLGKCIIVAFLDKTSFHAFEEKFMENPNSEGSAGIHHASTNGRALIACCRGNDPTFFAKVMVHETSHGFLHRLRSNVSIPPWINEGVADWVASVIVKNSPTIAQRQKAGIELIRQTNTLGEDFFMPDAHLSSAQYGIASNLTNFMLQIDPGRYRVFILGIKEGYSLEESLARSYGVTPGELIGSYGRSIGMANLRP